MKAKTWLIFADHFTGWVSVWYFEKGATAKGLVKILRDQFTTFSPMTTYPSSVLISTKNF